MFIVLFITRENTYEWPRALVAFKGQELHFLSSSLGTRRVEASLYLYNCLSRQSFFRPCRGISACKARLRRFFQYPKSETRYRKAERTKKSASDLIERLRYLGRTWESVPDSPFYFWQVTALLQCLSPWEAKVDGEQIRRISKLEPR